MPPLALSQCQSIADLEAYAAQWFAAFDGENNRHLAASGTHLACAAGCSICCSLRVDVLAHEVFHLARHLRATRSPEELLALRERLAAHTPAIRALTPFGHATQNIRCVLLQPDGRCGVYAARPQSCRRHHSRDVTACQYTYDHPDDLTTPAAHDLPLYRHLSSRMQVDADAYFDEGYDVTIYELSTALDEALADPECEARWLRREQAFLRASVTPSA